MTHLFVTQQTMSGTLNPQSPMKDKKHEMVGFEKEPEDMTLQKLTVPKVSL